jgi:hypothetical protein
MSATLFPVRDAWWYVPAEPGQARGLPSLGSSEYKADNPPFGALITWHLAGAPKTSKEARREREKEVSEAGGDVPFPGWDELAAESLEESPRVLLTIRDAAGHPVRRIEAKAADGLHRTAWDLRRPAPDPVDFEVPAFMPPWVTPSVGPLVAPGTYTVEMALAGPDGTVTSVGERRSFEVVALPGFSLGEPDFAAYAAFTEATWDLIRHGQAAAESLGSALDRMRYMRRALVDAPRADAALLAELETFESHLTDLRTRLQGDGTRDRFEEPAPPSILRRAFSLTGLWDTRQAPTKTQRDTLALAGEQFEAFRGELAEALETELPALEEELEAAGAVWTPGRALPD